MKICLVNNLYKPYSRGGAERVLELIVEGLKSLGHEVIVITTRPLFFSQNLEENQEAYYIPSTYYYWNKIPKIFRPLFHFCNFFNIFVAYKILRILKINKVEIIITNNLLGLNLFFLLRLKKIVRRHIHILHDIQLLHPSGLMLYGEENIINTIPAKIYQCIARRFFINTDKIISPSKWLLKIYKSKNFFSGKKATHVHNPVKMNLNTKIKRNINTKGSHRILFVGLLSKAKGILILLEAFKKISTNTDTKLCLIGKNLIGKNLYDYINNFNNMEYMGVMEHSHVIEKMVQSDILVMPSLCYENSPTVIYEAISIGLPVIASDIAGIPELADIGQVKMFKPGDSDDLIRKINSFNSETDNLNLKPGKSLNSPSDYAGKILM